MAEGMGELLVSGAIMLAVPVGALVGILIWDYARRRG